MRSLLRLVFAMALRVVASICYVGLIALTTSQNGAHLAAEVVYVFAVSFVSANLGRYGSDQQIAKSARYFRTGFGVRAGSLVSTHVAFSVTVVPLFALLIHSMAGPLLVHSSPGHLAAPSLAVVMLSSAGLALSQTVSAACQASGYPSASVVAFPLLTYLLLAMMVAVFPALPAWGYATAFMLPGILFIAALAWQGHIKPMPVRLQLLRGNGHYYVMGLSFYISVWLPFVYLPGLLDAASVVMLNLAMRLSSIQSLPSNAVAGYLMPRFALHAHKGEFKEIERIMRQVIGITLVFQVVYILALALAFLLLYRTQNNNAAQFLAVMAILSLGQIVNGVTGPVGPALMMVGQQKFMAKTAAAICAVGICGGYVLTVFAGPLGFSIATSIATVVQNVVYAFRLNLVSAINPYKISLTSTPKT